MSISGSRLFRAAAVAGAGVLSLALVTCGGSSTIVPEGTHYHYVANTVLVPTNNTQAREYGLDLNNDGTVDNQLGMVLGTLAGMGFDIQGTIDKAVAEGDVILLVDFQTKDATFMSAAAAGLGVLLGTNPMPAACNGSADVYQCVTGSGSACTSGSAGCTCSGCGHHLDGTAQFTLADGQTPMELAGPIIGGTFKGGPGEITLQIALASSNPITLNLIGARSQASGITATTIGTATTGGAILAGALTQDDLNNKVIPAIQQQLVPIIQRDCCGAATSPGGVTCNPASTGTNPNCGCIDGSTGKTILGLFDTNPKDCTVSVMEISTNSLIESLLAPDVTINGTPALSLGIKVTTVGATFTVPGETM